MTDLPGSPEQPALAPDIDVLQPETPLEAAQHDELLLPEGAADAPTDTTIRKFADHPADAHPNLTESARNVLQTHVEETQLDDKNKGTGNPDMALPVENREQFEELVTTVNEKLAASENAAQELKEAIGLLVNRKDVTGNHYFVNQGGAEITAPAPAPEPVHDIRVTAPATPPEASYDQAVGEQVAIENARLQTYPAPPRPRAGEVIDNTDQPTAAGFIDSVPGLMPTPAVEEIQPDAPQ